MVYIEPFLGGGSVLLNKERSCEEWANDVDPGVMTLWRVIRDQPGKLEKILSKLKYSESTFEDAADRGFFRTDLERAVNEYVVRRMSRGGMMKSFSSSNRLRGGKPGDVNGWETSLKQIPVISARIQEVTLLNKNTLDILKIFNSRNVVAYIDPPYLPETRVSSDVYRYEMTADQHHLLLNCLKNFKGKVLLSGYRNDTYDAYLKRWHAVSKTIVNHSSQQKEKPVKEEVLYKNF
jgi:DNA adenine methylase